MGVKKIDSGWLIDIQPGGRGGRRYRKTFSTKSEALAWESWLKTQVNQVPDWTPQKRDTRRLSDLISAWFKHHGHQLRAGKDTHNRLIAMCEFMGNPIAEKFTASTFADYRTKRIATGISANNMNRERAYLRAVFNELRRIGEWNGDNSLSKLHQFKIEEQELSYLTTDEIKALLAALAGRNGDAYLVSKVCLSTGARWSEAEGLKRNQIRNNQIAFN